MFDIIFSENTLKAGMILATPILLAGLGGAICSKSGFFNIALEGFMLIGAFFGVVGAYFFSNSFVGIIMAVAVTTLYALLYGLLVFKFKANEVIAGFGFNMLALGLTGWMIAPIFGSKGSFFSSDIPTIPKINIKLLNDIPVVKSVINNQNVIVYLSWILIFALFIMIYKTKLGYRIRAMGENPSALQSAGMKTFYYRYIAVAIAGALCGLAGAFISLGDLGMFTENMTAGRGFIAVTAVIFSSGYIPITALASFLFGMAFSIGIQFQGIGMPPEFVEMTPYVLTVVFLVLSLRIDSIAKKKRKGEILKGSQ